MNPRQLRLRNPTNAAFKLAIVSLSTGDVAGTFVVTVARGEKRTKLTDSRLYGPFSADEAEKAWTSVLAGLAADGYLSGGLGDLLETIATSKSPKQRARAAEKLGWRPLAGNAGKVVDVLLARAEKPKDDISTVVTALGRIAAAAPAEAARVIPLLRAEAERKLLSRRRSGCEALRLINDVDGLQGVRTRALERMPDKVRARLLELDERSLDGVNSIKDLVVAAEEKERGSCCDALYDIGTPLAVASARASLLALDVSKPGVWRYCKSVIKRAAIRNDGETFGALMHAVEKRGRTSKGQKAKLKSGLDGELRDMRVFSRHTVDWMRRASWRFLRMLAKWKQEQYPLFAAWCVAPYSDDDDVEPKKRCPANGRSYLLSRVLLGGSARFVVDSRTVRLLWKGQKPVLPTPGVREEAFKELWDLPTSRRAFHVLLGRARHRLAVKFAVDAVARDPSILAGASTADLARMLASPDDKLSDLAFSALRDRFKPEQPDLDALLELGAINNDRARTLAGLWLTSSAHIWSRDVALVTRLIGAAEAIREPATRLLLLALSSSTPAFRNGLADALLKAIDQAEPAEGAFAVWSELAPALAAELVARCDPAKALALVDKHDAGAAVAAVVIGSLADPLGVLGAGVVLKLASADKAARRKVAIAALNKSAAKFRDDLVLTLSMAEGEWDDVRAAVCAVLRGLDASVLDLSKWMAILDSTWPAVQDVGKDLLRARLDKDPDAVDVHELLARLAQHPHKNIRAFVVDLATQRLKPGYVRLAKLESMARAALFDTRPDRPLRRRLIAFLQTRGLQDEAQAELVCALLGDVVRSRTHEARDDAASTIAVLRLTWPELHLPDHVSVEVPA